MTDAIDRDFGAEDERSWTVEELFDEITRRAVDAIESDFAPAPLLAILVDLARIRTKTTPEPIHTEGE